MKGFFNLKPSRYNKIYNLDPILNIAEKWCPLEELSLSDLTHRLVILLEIVIAHRKQTYP